MDIELLGAASIDFAWVAQSALKTMATVAVQDDADVARH
jgi:hypothetical protein